jgi:hypothetical protein
MLGTTSSMSSWRRPSIACHAIKSMWRISTKQLTFLGIKLVTLSEGLISELHVGLSGTMGRPITKRVHLAILQKQGVAEHPRAGAECHGGAAKDNPTTE